MIDINIAQPALEAAMSELGGDLQLPMSFDHQNVCIFRYQASIDIAVQIFPDQGRITFAAVLVDEVDPSTPGLFPMLATFNWMGMYTRGGAVCINDETRSVLFWRDPVCTHWDAATLKLELEDFIGLAIDIRGKFDEGLRLLPEALTGTASLSSRVDGGRFA